MKLDANDRTLRAILNTYFFFIPRFQRPYSWEIEQVEELWEDAVRDSGPDYFIGSMVVYPHGDDTVAVIDGQQRLTTLMMFLCAIRNAADANEDHRLANGTHTFIERTDENDEQRFVLHTESSYPYLHDEILSRDKAELDAEVGAEERALDAAYRRVRAYVLDTVATVLIDPALSAEKKKKKVSTELSALRDRLLGLRLIFVEVGSQDAATTIFVTLNSRGKDLEPADLVKAQLLNLLPKKGQLDRPLEKWAKVVDMLDASQTPLNLTDFLLASWRSRYGATTAKKLHRDVRSTIKKPQASAFLDDLITDAELFRRVNEPDYYRKWTREGKEAARSLAFFRDFGIKQPMPLLLSLIREYDGKRISSSQVCRALRMIEDYHFGWTVLAGKSSTGGMSGLFGRFARELGKAADRNAKGVVINSLGTELRARRPSAAEWDEAFAALWFTDNYTSEKKVIQYALRRIYQHESPTAAVDFSHMTIEHLEPQAGGSDAVGLIGNLILVTESLNAKLDNKAWPEKRKLLRKADDQWIPSEVKSTADWGDEDILTRTGLLAVLGRTKVWKG